MLKEKFIKIADRFINLDHVVAIKTYEDGSVRVVNTLLNEDNASAPSYWDFDGEDAGKIKAFFAKNCTEL